VTKAHIINYIKLKWTLSLKSLNADHLITQSRYAHYLRPLE